MLIPTKQLQVRVPVATIDDAERVALDMRLQLRTVVQLALEDFIRSREPASLPLRHTSPSKPKFKWKDRQKAVVDDVVYMYDEIRGLCLMLAEGDNTGHLGDPAPAHIVPRIESGDYVKFDRDLHWSLLPQIDASQSGE